MHFRCPVNPIEQRYPIFSAEGHITYRGFIQEAIHDKYNKVDQSWYL
jgi:hypothetical protein